MTPRILVIHRALAPYRIDFFNELYARYQPDIYFEYPSLLEQELDTTLWKERIRFPYRLLRKGPDRLPNWRSELWKICSKGRYDVVLTSEINLITALLWGYKAFASHPMRLISICDDSYPMAQELINDSRSLKKQVINYGNLDGFILCDQRTERLYRDYFPKSNRFFTQPIIQDDCFIRGRYARVKEESMRLRSLYTHPYGAAARLLLFVGRLATEKNLTRLLLAFERAFSHSPEVQLLLVGSGPEEQQLRKYVAQSPLARQIFFCGKQEGDALYAHYAAADAFVLPSTLERFGAVANEALLMGLPLAVSEKAGIAAWAQEGGAIRLFNPYEVEEMSQTLQQLIFSLPPWQAERPSLMPISFRESMEQFHRNLLYLIN